MERDRWPKPLRGGFRLDLNRATEKAAKTAARAADRPLMSHRLKIGSQTYTAFDAHRIIEQASDEERARPGHPCG